MGRAGLKPAVIEKIDTGLRALCLIGHVALI
jgi:hypothetical protein